MKLTQKMLKKKKLIILCLIQMLFLENYILKIRKKQSNSVESEPYLWVSRDKIGIRDT